MSSQRNVELTADEVMALAALLAAVTSGDAELATELERSEAVQTAHAKLEQKTSWS